MMGRIPSLYIASVNRKSVGKTALCLGLASKLKEVGFKVGYFKPVGWETARYIGRAVDEDALLLKHALNLDEKLEAIAPILLQYQYLDQYRLEDYGGLADRIEEAYRKVSEGKDMLIIEALHEPCLGSFIKLSAMNLAKKFGSSMLLVSTTYNDIAVDEAFYNHSYAEKEGVKFAGLVFNYVPSPLIKRVRGVMAPKLEKQGIYVWGVIPECLPITAPTAKEIAEVLGAEVLCREDRLSNIVEEYLIGAMTAEEALRYFRKAPRKAVITGGDRPEIVLAALETDTSAIILTGNLYPETRVLAKADEKGTPILLVPYDTYTTINKIRGVMGKIRVEDEKRIELAKKHIAENIDWKGLLTYILKY